MIELGLVYDDNGLTTPDYEKAAGYYAEAYSEGSAQGAYLLGLMYEEGKGVNKDLAKSFELYKYAGEHGLARGVAKMGICYHDGLGVEKDVSKAVECFETAKAMGDESADNLLAFVYTKGKKDEADPKKVFEFNLKRAEEGDAEAQYQVYSAYENGNGVEEDREKADEWCRKAADNGHVIAQALVGFHEMLFGNTVTAVEYWEKASAGGHFKAMHDLAEIYLDGMDEVPQNKPRAIELFTESADKGYADSQCSLGVCYATGNGVRKDEYIAAQWFEKAAMQNQAFAQKNLGICYRHGQGVVQNKQKAAEWFRKAADQGNVQAQINLADMYVDGEGVVVDYAKAEQLYKQVMASKAEEFYDNALFNLALMYATKMNNNYKAFPLWQESAQRGNEMAQYNLGLCYHNGWGTTKDDDQALYWWRKSAAQGHTDAQHNINVLLQERSARTSYNSSASQNNSSSSSSGGCYVATAVYGSYDCPEVWTLRRFRDYELAETWYGRTFIRLYYAISPTIVKWFGDTSWFNRFWKRKLDQMVDKLQKKGIESTPYEDKTF